MNNIIYFININGKGKAKKLSSKFNLNEARKKLKLTTNDYFYLNDTIIEKNDEENFSIQEICDGKNIIIKSKNVSKQQLSVDICKKNGEKITSINIESKKSSLCKLRELLENKIKNNFKFLSTEKLIVKNLDESQFIIEDILNNKKIFINEEVPNKNENDYSSFNLNTYKMIFVKLNDKNIDILNANLKDNLATLRHKLHSKVNNSDLFIFKEKDIDFDRETELKIENILLNETIYMETIKLYDIKRNGDIKQIKLISNLKLDKLRLKLKLNNNELFYFKNKPIKINKEALFTIEDIQYEKIVEINKNNNNEEGVKYKATYTDINIGKNNPKKSNIEYDIFLNRRIIQKINLPPNEKLNSVRKWLSKKISENDLFKYNDILLDLDKEIIMDIKDIAIGNKIYIEKKETEAKKKKKLHKPITGSYFIREEGEIKIY